MHFKWDSPNISYNQIMQNIMEQYGVNQPIAIVAPNNDFERRTPYKNSLVKCHCNRCGKDFSQSPKQLLEAQELIGHICPNCGNLTDEQIRQRNHEQMLEQAAKDAEEKYGIDLSEEERRKEEAAKDEQRMAATDDDDYSDEEFSEDDIVPDDLPPTPPQQPEQRSVESAPVVEEKKSEPVVEPEPIPEPVHDEQREEADEDDVSKYMYDEEKDDSMTLEDVISDVDDDDDAIFGSDFDSNDDEEEHDVDDDVSTVVEDVTEQELAAEAAPKVEEEEETVVPQKASESVNSVNAVEEYKEEAAKNEPVIPPVKEPEVQEPKVEKKPEPVVEKHPAKEIVGEIVESSPEPVAPKPQTPPKEVVFNHSNPIKPNTNKVEPKPEVIEIKETKLAKAMEKVDAEETKQPTPEQTTAPKAAETDSAANDALYVNGKGKAFTAAEIQDDVKRVRASLVSKIGFYPYNPKVVPVDGRLSIKCGVCNSDVVVDDIDELDSKVVTLTREYCNTYGISYKAPNGHIGKIHYCPKCIAEVIQNGYNPYIRGMVAAVCKNSHLNIPKIDQYWFTTFGDEIIVEANGVERTMTIRQLVGRFNNGDKIIDARKEPDFQPRGNATKSATGENTAGVETKTAESSTTTQDTTQRKGYHYVNRSAPINGTAVDSNARLESERKIQDSSVEENSVFHINQSIKDDRSSIAKLNEKLCPFTRAKSLESSFQKTPFASFIDDLSAETGIDCALIINSRTYEIPFVDFENGYRIICIDLDNNSLTRTPYGMISNSVAFAYRGPDGKPMKNFKTMVLFSDSVERRRSATMDALIKHINPSILPYKDKKIVLEDTILTQYTDYPQYLREFEAQYSTFPTGKPKTGSIGIVGTWVEDDDKKADLRSIMKFQSMMQDTGKASLNQLNNDYSQYMVASIKYIERYNDKTHRVVYSITDYIEIGSAIVADGLLQCVRALLHEYTKRYPQLINVAPHIILEIDPNTFPSPSLTGYIKKGTLKLVDDVYRAVCDGDMNVMRKGKPQYLKYTYVKRSEFRVPTKDGDWCRQDMRMFQAATLSKTMESELKAAGIASGIADDNTRLAFISSQGFVKNNQLEVKEYFFNQTVVQNLLVDSKTELMQKLPTPDEMFVKAGMVESAGNGFNINSVMSNPALMRRYMNIMNNGTPEAKTYFVNNVINGGQQPLGYNYGQQMQMNGMMGQIPLSMQQQAMMSNMQMGGMQMGMNFGMQQPMMGMGMPQQRMPGMY